MSNAKYIIVDGLEGATEYLPVATYFLKVVRKLGHTSITKTFYIGKAEIRIHLDQYAGDRVYIKAAKCPIVTFSGLLDTFRDKVRPPGHTPKYLIDNQLAKEYRLPRSPSAPVPTAKLMYGVRPISATARLVDGLSGDAVPTITQGVDGDLYTVDGTIDVYQKELGKWYLLPQDTSEPRLTTKLPVEATTVDSVSLYGDPIDPPTATVDYSLFKETYQRLHPSRFTGLMRQVVQVTLATSAWRGLAPTTTPIPKPAATPVNYQFGDSWGCIKNGKLHHFIQITGDAVYHVPAEYCAHTEKVNGVDTDVVVLRSADVASRVKIGDIPSGLGGSWDREIGWSFSYDVPEASIVYTSTMYSGSTDRVSVSLLTLSFGFSGTGIPSTAICSQTDPKILFYPAFMSTVTGHALFNKVTSDGAGGVINITADFGFQYLGDPGPINYRADNIPIYVYYSPGKGRQLCTYSYIETQAGSETRADPGTTSVSCSSWSTNTGAETSRSTGDSSALIAQGWTGTKSIGFTRSYGFSVAGSASMKSRSSISNAHSEYVVGGKLAQFIGTFFARFEAWGYSMYVGFNPAAPAVLPYTTIVGLTTVIGGTYASISGCVTGQSSTDAYTITKNDIVETRGGSNMTASLTLSVYDRECALVYETIAEESWTNTSHITYGNMFQYTSDDGMVFAYSRASGSDAIQGIITSIKGPVYNTIYNSTCTNVSISGDHDLDLPRTKMYNTATGALVSKVQAIQGFSDPVTPTSRYIAQTPTPNPSGCGTVTAYTDASTAGIPVSAYNNNTSGVVPGTATLTLYSNSAPTQISIGANTYRLSVPTPNADYTLAYIFSQAAFDPANCIKHSVDIGSLLVAKVGATTYDVKNKLFGWIGVV